MIKWYEDKDITIAFDRVPNVAMRYALPSMTAKEKHKLRASLGLKDDDFVMIECDKMVLKLKASELEKAIGCCTHNRF